MHGSIRLLCSEPKKEKSIEENLNSKHLHPKQTPNQPAAQQSYKGVLESSPLVSRPLYAGA